MSDLGIENGSIIKSLGMFMIGISLILLISLFYYTIKSCKQKCKCCNKLQSIVSKRLFYSGPLRVVVAGYLKFMNQFVVLICFGIVKNMSVDEKHQNNS